VEVIDFIKMAAQYRRLARHANDGHARRELLTLAEEYEAAVSALTGNRGDGAG
jgi:hypothetical protein